MSAKASVIAFIGLALLLAAWFRLPKLQDRPMHGDEAVHAIKFGMLLEQGIYRYDPDEYHGPTLNMLSLLPALLSGSETLTEIDERHLRIIPAICGLALVALSFCLLNQAGQAAILSGAFLVSVSPGMVFFSRYYIQEVLLVFFAFGFLVCCLRYLREPKYRWATSAGVALGLMHATKETFVIYLACMALAAGFTYWRYQKRLVLHEKNLLAIKIRQHLIVGLLTACLVSMLLFSSFFTNPEGIVDSVLTLKTYLNRANVDADHLHPWFAYLQWLFLFTVNQHSTFAETAVLPLTIAGFYFALRQKNAGQWIWSFFATYTILLFVAFSLIPYKTPWNALAFLHGLLLMAGYGAFALFEWLSKKPAKWVWVGTSMLAFILLSWQSYRLNYRNHADASQNPYLYAHPTKDIFKMVDRIRALSAQHDDSSETYIQIAVRGSDYWPLPWHLRDLKNIGWWDHLDRQVPPAPIIIISEDLEKKLTHILYEVPPPGQRPLYVPFFDEGWQLRPGVALHGYARKDLWDRFYISTQEKQ